MITISDGVVSIKIEIDGKQVEIASKELDRLEDAGHRGGKGAKQAEEGMKGVDRESSKAGGSVKRFAASLGLVAIGATAFKVLRASMDDAISRFDTMNNFPKVLQALGVSAEDSERAVNRLSDGIDGLPTKLDDIASTAQQMYTSFNDMDKATDSALALNNALLSQSADAGQAKRGTEQYLKVLQTGKVDMQTWTTLSETMDIGLIKIAESFGYVGDTAKNDLYRALQDGTITVKQFNDELINLGTGTGELAELAKKNSLGLATSVANLRTAVARGVTYMIEKLNDLSIAVTGNEIAGNIDKMKVVVYGAFQAMGNMIEAITPAVALFALGFQKLLPIFDFLSPLIIGFTVALTASIGITTAATLAIKAKTAAVIAYSAAMAALSGPIGWVSVGIGAVVAGTVAIVKWFNRTSEEAERLHEELDELSEAHEQLADSVESSAKGYEANKKQIETNAEANKQLMRQVDELARKENKSASEKRLLASYVDDLNNSIDDLNLTYDEESDALNATSEQLMKRIELMQEEEKMIASQERLKETIQEQIEIGLQMEDIVKVREDALKQLEEGSITEKEYNAIIEEQDELHKDLMDTLVEVTEERIAADEELTESTENYTQLLEENADSQIFSYERLKDAQREVFDEMISAYEELVDHATDAFDRMNDESKLTAEEMIDNLEHNQKVTREWGENIAYLYEFAAKDGHEGFMQWLDKLGPESAAELAVIADMSEGELKRFAELMDEGATVASESFKKTLGDELDETVDVMVQFVDDGATTMRERVEKAGFDEIGKYVPEGYAGGIEEGAPEAEKAAEKMAQDTIDVAKDTLETRSPSRVFEEIGESAPEGMALGVNKGTSKVLKTSQELFKLVIGEFDNTYSQFNRIGQDSMSGLNAGLNAGRGRVLSTARSIANQVTATMQNALKIKSPSQIMRDKVGRWIPEGVAEGIEGNTNSALRAAVNMTNRMIKFERPEIALGASMAQSSQLGNTTVNNFTKNYGYPTNTRQVSGSDKKVYVQSIVNLDGREIAEGTWKEISKLLNRDAQIKARFKGVKSVPLR